MVWSTAPRLNGASSAAAVFGVIGRGIVDRRADRRREILADQPRVEPAGEVERGVRARGGRGHEHAAVGQRLERRDPVVLAARRGDEHARAPQQRSVLLGRQPPGHLDAVDRVDLIDPGDQQRLAVAAGLRPGTQDVIQALLLGVAGVGHREHVALGDRRPGRIYGRWHVYDALRCGGLQPRERPLAHREHERGLGEAPALDHALPDPVASGAVLGRERVEPDRAGPRPQQRGGHRAVDDRLRLVLRDRAAASRAAPLAPRAGR